MAASTRIGVDLVELKKAGAFYRAHRKRLPLLIQKSKRPVEALAFYLAKKEAAFKAGAPVKKKSRLRFSYSKTAKYVTVSCVGI